MAKRLRYNMNACIGCQTCSLVCSTLLGYHSLSESAIYIKTKGGLQSQYVCVVCVACTENISCLEACRTGALEARPGGGVIFDKKKCISCRRCVSACSIGAVQYSEALNQPVICRHCSTCTRFCPHQCLWMEEVEIDGTTSTKKGAEIGEGDGQPSADSALALDSKKAPLEEGASK
ncbi:MAG: 4Fe-4S binding protein [Erysipelotrichaceae bacterium]|nr:4Fe-4S binding protein [Erysipelotrichaceae bacterium]